MNTLPLSWCRKDAEYSTYHTVKLPLCGMTWISTAEVPFSYSVQDLHKELTTNYSQFIVRGLTYNMARYFSQNGADVLQTGAEAIVDLSTTGHFKPAVYELAKRGGRHGSVKEISYSLQNEEKLKQLIDDSAHGKEPRLLNLYRMGFDKSVRCFVLAGPEDFWLGAVTVSLRDASYVHTESILRRKDAPVGVMETIFLSMMNILRAEGCKQLSLGEVPFVHGDKKTGFSQGYLEKLLLRSRLLFGYSFDYKGLYNFKNKFGPSWSPVYMAAKPGISKRLLIDLYLKSHLHELTVFKLLGGLKRRFPAALKP